MSRYDRPARDQIIAKARRSGWHVTQYSKAISLKKDGVTLAVRFGGNKNGEGVEAASWNRNAITGQNKLAKVLKALDS